MRDHGVVTQDIADLGEAEGFDEVAARALVLADFEAGQLGHDRVGTEHLLLGLLTNDSATSKMLSDAGVTLAAARNKVSEAVGIAPRGNRGGLTSPLPRTPRANSRARTFVAFRPRPWLRRRDKSSRVDGCARRRGDRGPSAARARTRRRFATRCRWTHSWTASADEFDSTSRALETLVFRSAMCPSCNASLESNITYRVVPARGEDGQARDALIFAVRWVRTVPERGAA